MNEIACAGQLMTNNVVYLISGGEHTTVIQHKLITIHSLQVLLAAVTHQYHQPLVSQLLHPLILLVHLLPVMVSHHLLILLVHLLIHLTSVTIMKSDWPTFHKYRSLITLELQSVDHKCVSMDHM